MAWKIGNTIFDQGYIQVEGVRHSLPQRQYEVLNFLMSRCGRVATRDAMMDAIWGENAEGVFPKTVDVAVCRIRSKLTAFGSDLRITTTRDVGYSIEDDTAKIMLLVAFDEYSALSECVECAMKIRPVRAEIAKRALQT